MFSPSDRYVWDFWTIQEGESCYLYYLQAPKAIQSSEDRHRVASVGLATSSDLQSWKDHGTVFKPSETGWDNMCIWTGSVCKHGDGIYYMLYTGRCVQEQGRVQRVGLAVSDDLFHWKRAYSFPLLEADGRYYEKLEESIYLRRESWRDPYLFYDSTEQCWYAFITARANTGAWDERGCIAVARSNNMKQWEILPPLKAPADFYEMEVPTVWVRGGRYYLTFATKAAWYSRRHISKIAPKKPQTGVFYYTADELMGPYRPVEQEVLLGEDSACYTNRIVRATDGCDYLLTWKLHGQESKLFIGGIDKPRKITYQENGSLSLKMVNMPVCL